MFAARDLTIGRARERRRRAGCLRGEQGVALLCALMVTTVVGTLGGALVFLATTESLISANHRIAQQALFAADAGIERAIAGLRTLEDWTAVPGTPGVPSIDDFQDFALAPRTADGTVLDLSQLTRVRQAGSDALFGGAPNAPVWRLLAHAPLARLMPAGVSSPPAYVVVWVADDVDDEDGDPLRDSNGVLMVHAEAFASSGTRRRVEAILARERQPIGAAAEEAGEPPAETAQRTEIRLMSWREVR
jgi:hypothetical protein